ncbi:uncharacterized protein LOC106086850 [Stomoxys calcitrans]|uniref:Syntaxin N-terminal domain-containing protein n=1 Tax=Stomoxys calcitrans TaxID=35570 RepID=A0A1I8PLL2_STOCA|nr:uncharacterized protein LOC106086850 [Stomoxys calcitrans]
MLTTHHLPHLHHRGSTAVELEKITNLNTLIVEINSHVALFRDLLIHVGQSKDCPELREKIRKLRRTCVEAFKRTEQILMPQVKNATADGVLADNPHLVLLFYMAQLFLRELVKSYRLIQVVPMDMSGYYENRAGPSNLGNVISQILLCKQITPDFNQEELCSITKDSQDIAMLLSEMQEFMPQHETYLERHTALDTNGPWTNKGRHNYICKNMSLLCCVSRPNYL